MLVQAARGPAGAGRRRHGRVPRRRLPRHRRGDAALLREEVHAHAHAQGACCASPSCSRRRRSPSSTARPASRTPARRSRRSAAGSAPRRKWLRAAREEPADAPGPGEGRLQGDASRSIARKAGYKPESAGVLRGARLEAEAGGGGPPHGGPRAASSCEKRERFDGLSEAEICEAIETQKLSYKDVVGRLPKDVGLTPAIMVALLPSLSDRDLRMLTPTLEELGLMAEPEIRARWEKAIADGHRPARAQHREERPQQGAPEKLEEASDNAARKAVAEATAEADVRVMFLIDKSGSMEGAIEKSKEALSRILAGFPLEKLHIATLRHHGHGAQARRRPSRAAVQHMLAGHQGGRRHDARGRRCARCTSAGVRVPARREAHRHRRGRRGRRGGRPVRARLPRVRLHAWRRWRCWCSVAQRARQHRAHVRAASCGCRSAR